MDEGIMMEEDNGYMMAEEDDHDDNTSSCEDEIMSMCCKNLKDAQNVVALLEISL
jgi:hypothetical protein